MNINLARNFTPTSFDRTKKREQIERKEESQRNKLIQIIEKNSNRHVRVVAFSLFGIRLKKADSVKTLFIKSDVPLSRKAVLEALAVLEKDAKGSKKSG